MHTKFETKTLELLNSKVQIYTFKFQKFPVDCDPMMHVLKNFYINVEVTHFNKDRCHLILK